MLQFAESERSAINAGAAVGHRVAQSGRSAPTCEEDRTANRSGLLGLAAAAIVGTTVDAAATVSGGIGPTADAAAAAGSPVRRQAGDLWADVILGQSDFTEVAPNRVVANRLFNPNGVLVDRTVERNRVYVYDAGNNRVIGLSHLGACAGDRRAGGFQPCRGAAPMGRAP